MINIVYGRKCNFRIRCFLDRTYRTRGVKRLGWTTVVKYGKHRESVEGFALSSELCNWERGPMI